MRPIDADALVENAEVIYMKHGNIVIPTRVIPISDLHMAPTIDVVSVVRCKSCVLSRIHQETQLRICTRYSKILENGYIEIGIPVKDDHFCAYGKKKSEVEL